MAKKSLVRVSLYFSVITSHFREIFAIGKHIMWALLLSAIVVLVKESLKNFQQDQASQINKSKAFNKNPKNLLFLVLFSTFYIVTIPIMEILGVFVESNIISVGFVLFYRRFLKYKYHDWAEYLKGDLYSIILRRTKGLSGFVKTLFSEFIDNGAYMVIRLVSVYATYRFGFSFFKILLLLLFCPAIITLVTLARKYTLKKSHESFDVTEKKLKDIFLNYEMIHTYGMVDAEVAKYTCDLYNYLFWFKAHWILNNLIDFSTKMLSSITIITIFKSIISSTDMAFQEDRAGTIKDLMEKYGSVLKRNITLASSLKTMLENSELIVHSNLDNLPIEKEKVPRVSKQAFEKDIVVENLTKSYGDLAIFKDVNLRIERGDKIAITGHNGSGKTSFSKILANIERYGGSIFIDGVNILHLENRSLRNLIGFVPQDDSLFEASVMENLTLFNSSMGQDEVVERVKEFDMHEDIKKIGYDRMVVDDGSNLSPGERQKICFLRAVMQNRPILVFDEITSRMNKTQEAAIINSVLNKLKDCTVVMIIHNLNVLEKFDKVIFFGNSTASEALPLETLKSQSPEFSEYLLKGTAQY